MTFPAYPDSRDSGVEWLGVVPEHWVVKPLRYLGRFRKGLTITKADLTDTGIPCLSYGEVHSLYPFEVNQDIQTLKCVPADYLETESSSCIGYGDFVFADTSEDLEGVGNFTHVSGSEPLFAGYHTIIYSLDSDVSSRFLAYCLESFAFRTQLRMGVKGVKVFSITQEILRGGIAWVPTKAEQTQIARFLDHETARIDALIEEQQRLIELVKEKRQAVISHAVTKGLDPTVTMKDSGVEWLGEVPAHWVVSRAKLVSDIFVPQRNKPELNDSEGIAWVTMEDMNGGYISATNLKVTELAAEEAGSKVLKKGAVIASCVGRFGIVAINAVDVIINQQLQAFEPRKIKAEYLKNIVSLSKEYFELIGTAATLVYVNQQGFENLPVLIPSVSEQESICLYVDEANARFDALLSQSFESIQLLQERRSALISAAVTGKIDVRGWQQPASAPTPELAQEAL